MKKKLVVLLAVVCVLCMAQSAFAWKIASFRTWPGTNGKGETVTKYEIVIDDSNWEVSGKRFIYMFYDSKRRPVATYKRLIVRDTIRIGRDIYDNDGPRTGECMLIDGFQVEEYPNYEAAGNPVSVRYSNGRFTILGSCVGVGYHADIDRVSVIRVTSVNPHDK